MKRLVLTGLVVLLPLRAPAEAEERFEYLWNVSVGGGVIKFEGDEEVEDSFVSTLRIGCDWTDQWTIEASLYIVPDLDENFANSYGERVSRLERAAGPGVHETSAFGVALDGLFHFTRWERLDPFLSLGVGMFRYEDDIGSQADPSLRVGGGLMYHLSDNVSLRADARMLVAGDDTEANAIVTGGLMWTFSARVETLPSPGPVDSDGDGLLDTDELKTHKTDPLNRDTDYDGLTDAEEIETHKTDPLNRDTDGGKVADGHEVIEDKTRPLHKADDLMFFELNMQFEGGKWDIRPEYFSDLDAIAAILKSSDGAVARIEGHDDWTDGRSARGCRRVTRKRADAVAAYLEKNWKIDDDRLESVGYGFDRPMGPNHPQDGNPRNRRMEIYIRMP